MNSAGPLTARSAGSIVGWGSRIVLSRIFVQVTVQQRERPSPSALEVAFLFRCLILKRNRNATSSAEMKGKASPTKILLDKTIWNPCPVIGPVSRAVSGPAESSFLGHRKKNIGPRGLHSAIIIQRGRKSI
jgi:hypothetical protein